MDYIYKVVSKGIPHKNNLEGPYVHVTACKSVINTSMLFHRGMWLKQPLIYKTNLMLLYTDYYIWTWMEYLASLIYEWDAHTCGDKF